MLELLNLQLQSGRFKPHGVQILFPARAGKVSRCSNGVAEINQTVGRLFACRPLRCTANGRRHTERPEQPANDRHIQIVQLLPWRLIEAAQLRQIAVSERRPRIMHLDGAQVLTAPGHGLIDTDLVHQLAETMEDRHRDPLTAIRCSDPIPILPLILFELHGIQGDEQIRLIDLVQITKPRQKLRLMNRDTHESAFRFQSLS